MGRDDQAEAVRPDALGGSGNPSYCKAAFDSLHVAIGGAVKPCCLYKGDIGNVGTASLEDIWNGPQLVALRSKMQRAERDAQCKTCYDMEDAGGHSLRHTMNGGVRPRSLDTRVADLPTILDVRLSNRCNLKCRTCGPDASSKWYADAQKLGWKMQTGALIEAFGDEGSALAALEPLLDTLRQINFAGGEPLIHADQYAIVEELIRRGRTDVDLSYISNMTELRLRQKDILEIWSQFENVSLVASIDGHKKIGELVRDGISWDRFTRNVTRVRTVCPHVKMMFNITVSVFNVHSLPDLCRCLSEIEGAAEIPCNLNVLQDPSQLSIQILPADMKAKVQRDLEAFAASSEGTPRQSREDLTDQIQAVISYMNFRDRSAQMKRFRRDTLRLDELRGQETIAVIPELAPVLQESFLEGGLRKVQDEGRALLRRLGGSAR